VLPDPGGCPLDNPAEGQDVKDVAIPFGHDLDRRLHGGRPDGELAGGISGIGSDQADLAAGAVQILHSSGRAPWRSWTFAAVITAARVAAGVHRDVAFAAVDLSWR
jgi:hypothetical protein